MKISITIAFLILCNCAAFAQNIYAVKSDNLSVRSTRNINTKKNVMLELQEGDQVTFVSRDKSKVQGHLWFLVRLSNGKKGYVFSEDLAPVNPSIPQKVNNGYGMTSKIPIITSKTPNNPVKKIDNSGNAKSKAYWDAGNELNDSLVSKVKQIFAQSIRPDATADIFFDYADKINNLDDEGVHQEIITDVQRKVRYYIFSANKVKSSFPRYAKKGAEWAVAKIINLLPELVNMKHELPNDFTIWNNSADAKAIEEMLNKTDSMETKTIESVQTIYGLKLKKW